MSTMRNEKTKRVEVNPAQSGLAGLGDAFSGLGNLSLPAAAPTPEVAQKARKLGRVVLRKETAHRGGKTVIVVHELPTHLLPSELEVLAKELRQVIGTGGALKGRVIEMQGDQPAKIRAFLEKKGYQVAGV